MNVYTLVCSLGEEPAGNVGVFAGIGHAQSAAEAYLVDNGHSSGVDWVEVIAETAGLRRERIWVAVLRGPVTCDFSGYVDDFYLRIVEQEVFSTVEHFEGEMLMLDPLVRQWDVAYRYADGDVDLATRSPDGSLRNHSYDSFEEARTEAVFLWLNPGQRGPEGETAVGCVVYENRQGCLLLLDADRLRAADAPDGVLKRSQTFISRGTAAVFGTPEHAAIPGPRDHATGLPIC